MDWKDLVIEDLPPGVFNNKYNIQYFNGVWMDSRLNGSAFKLLRALIDKPYKYRYCRKEVI